MKLARIFSVLLLSTFCLAISAQCDEGEIETTLSISTDDWGYEVYWEIVPGGNNCGDGTFYSGGNDAVGCNGGGDQNQNPGGYPNNSTIEEGPWCLLEGEDYTLIYVDDWGDGGATFGIVVEGVTIHEFVGSGSGNSWDFTVFSPPAFDASVISIESYSYTSDNAIPATGDFANLGTETIQDIELVYSVNGSQFVTESFNGLNMAPGTIEEFAFIDNMNLIYGENDIEISVVSINGSADENPSNDATTKIIELGNPIPNVIDGYLNSTPEINVISGPGDGVNTPRDLDFHPILSRFELWVINKGTEGSGGSTVRFENVGFADQDSESESDGNAWHFMSLPTGIAFGENENFGTSPGVHDANHDGGTPFTGPSLWSSVDEIYAEPSGGNGSHLDMLHVSPRSQGIAHEVDNVYWVVDGFNQDIVRYDFAEDHGPGGSFHGDARIRRFADFEIEKDPADHIVSHCVLDKSSGWLYVVDHGNQRVLRMDINSGFIGSTPSFGPFETIQEYRYVVDYTWEVIVDQDLDEPAGIDIVGNRLIVSDHANGDIVVYDTDNDFVELGRIETGESGIMGIKVGPWGRVWFVNASTSEVSVIEGNPLLVETTTQEIQWSIFPNPVSDELTISLDSPAFGLDYRVTNMIGELVIRGTKAIAGQTIIDVSNLESGLYIVSCTRNGEELEQMKFIKN